MKTRVFIGIDDTDIIGSPGTGKVARDVSQHLVELGLAESLGVSRHQLLVDPRVKYTSHNSCKGVAVQTERPIADLYQPCIAALKRCFQPGSDPGLCLCPEERVDEELLCFGRRAEIEVLTKQEARDLADRRGIFLEELGGDGGGIIGALAAVGLRASGNNGRLVDCRGVREIKGIISVRDLKQHTAIAEVRSEQGTVLGDEEFINSLDWIRPSLIGGRPILRVKLSETAGERQLWIPAEKAFTSKEEH
ncbi:MAG: hypothetical protein WA705_29600 [Candidatus Ozemobacteraceae bacterium]